MLTGIFALVSVLVNAVAAVVAPLVASKMERQRSRLAQAETALGMVADGIAVIERAVEENKDSLSQTGAGDKIAQTIRAYGPAAKQLVDAARSAAQQVRESADAAVQ